VDEHGRCDDQGSLGGGKKPAENPTDRAKRGTKRSLLVEAGGVPVGLSVAGANRNDFKLFAETLQSIPVEKPKPTPRRPQHVCLDKGYDYDEVRALLQAHGFVAHIRSRGEKTKEKKSAQQARRWVVERTHSWFNRFRSILTRWSKKADNYLGMLYFVCGMTAYRAAGFFG
jgi:transposase